MNELHKKQNISASDDIILNLKILAREKESVRRKLAITAAKLAVTAEKLAATAREKESVRRKLVVTAAKLKKSHETLEQNVIARTKDLEMSRAKEGAILQSIGDGLLATNEKGTITFVNKTAEKLLGKKRKNILDKIFSEVIPLEDRHGLSMNGERHPVCMALAMSTTTDAQTQGITYYYVRKDGIKVPLAITATPVMLNGKIIGSIEVFRDITYEREIDKAKTEFVSLASHQLRTPLSTVNWYSEMLLAGDVGELNEKQTKYLNEVYKGNQRMVELVNALLDVSRLELGTFVIDAEPTDITALAQNVIDEQMPEINKKHLRFDFSPEKNLSLGQVDPKHLRMVVQNILSNAVKYTPQGGNVDVSISRTKGKQVLLKISDTGYGIPKNQQAKICTKLFRADNVRDKDTDGTGLGLYIVKSIVENSGGKLWFSSNDQGENTGTTFYVALPVDGMTK